MAQNYHDEIRAALAAQGINNQTPQDVRDRAILAHNQSKGRDPLMALFGARNEGIAPAQSAQVAAQSPQTAPQMQQMQQMPAQAPVPQARPMDAAIDATLGDDVPIPTPRPVMQDGLEGDAAAMERIAATQQPTPQSAIATAVDEADAASQTVPETAQVEPEEAIAQEEADASAETSENAARLLDAVILLGGTAAAAALYQRYQQGDPDAMRTFAAIGMDPEDFSMFADAGPRSASSEPDQSRFNGDPTPVQRAEPLPPQSATERLPMVRTQSPLWQAEPDHPSHVPEAIAPGTPPKARQRVVAPTQRAGEEKPRQRVPARTRNEGDDAPKVRAKGPRVKR